DGTGTGLRGRPGSVPYRPRRPAERRPGPHRPRLGIRDSLGPGSEGVWGQVAADSDPLDIGEGVQVCLGATVPGAGAGLADAAERDEGLVVDGLVVDVHQPGRDAFGQGEALA